MRRRCRLSRGEEVRREGERRNVRVSRYAGALSDTAILQLFETLVDDALRARVHEACSEKRWYFGNYSVGAADPGFWKMDLDGVPAIDALWTASRERCEALSNGPLAVVRQYANGHTYGLGGQAHADDPRPGHFTLLYYPMPEWDPAWGGETVFHHATGEIALSVLPKPGRAVFFDSRILHAGRAPQRSYGGLRVTVALKLGPRAL
ncbi:MAG TPA: 2OG-Fe(II) oxygenase [Polyangiaceae bacterium]|nr:2OG-Fe(II) oxygenase [Polyangiaceae bacterium]